MYDMIIRVFDMAGKTKYMPLVVKDGEEIYRGEHQNTAILALVKYQLWLERQGAI